MTKRVSVIRVNLDDMAAQLDVLHTASQRSDWLSGFRSGARGTPIPHDIASEAMRMGAEFGLSCYAGLDIVTNAVTQPVSTQTANTPLSLWIRTRTSDSDRTRENQESLAGLIKRFTLRKVQEAAERIVASTHQKIWPDDERLLSQLMSESSPSRPSYEPEELPDDLRQLPAGHPLRPKGRA